MESPLSSFLGYSSGSDPATAARTPPILAPSTPFSSASAPSFFGLLSIPGCLARANATTLSLSPLPSR